jgi:hypothetical protein
MSEEEEREAFEARFTACAGFRVGNGYPDCPECEGGWEAWLARAQLCPRGDARPEPSCTNRHQCWEPCGELGHSLEHAAVAPGQNSKEER